MQMANLLEFIGRINSLLFNFSLRFSLVAIKTGLFVSPSRANASKKVKISIKL